MSETARPPGNAPEPKVASPTFAPARSQKLIKLTLLDRLFTEGYCFDFFQAVRILTGLDHSRRPIGYEGPPDREAVRLRAHLAVSFPPSAIYEIEPAPALPGGRPSGKGSQPPLMTVTFMGLYGPSGVLPAHYTELLLRLEQDQRGPERHALRAWLDLFNHRLLSLFSRAWEKYRFPILYERSFHEKAQDDPFTRVLFSLIGLGTNGLRQRLQVKLAVPAEPPAAGVPSVPGVLARIDDLALLHYAGLLSRQGRSALGLQALLEDYFGLPVKVVQFQGQWLLLDSASQSRMTEGGACLLGINTVAGGRVWDVQSKVRVRLGPLSYEQFTSFLPDLSPDLSKKNLFLLSHLTRLYLGMELDFEIQLVLRAAEVPPAQLTGGRGRGRQLGWNSWVLSRPAVADADQAVFEGQELTVVGGV